jgi:hypothetical protein
MFAMIRTQGADLDALGRAGDGSPWAFIEYPQGFHALAAAISQLMHPGAETGPDLLMAYTQAVGVVVVLGVVLVTAAIVSVPGLRDRAAVAVPAVIVTWAAFLWEPGQHALTDGFANFWLGAAAAGAAVVLAMTLPRLLSTPDLLAVGGLFVACALVRGRGDRCVVSRARIVAALSVAACTLVGLLRAASILFGKVSVGYLVTTATGGLHGTSPWPAFVMLALSLYCCLRYRSAADEATAPVDTRRVRLAALTPAGGFVVLAVVLVAQLHLVGTTEYYFLKYFIGYVLVLAVFTPAVCGLFLATRLPKAGSRRATVVCAAAALLATQSFGWFPHGTMPLFSTTGEGTAGFGGALRAAQVADGIIQHTLSQKVFARYEPWRTGCTNLHCAATLVTAVLRQERDVRVVVDPAYVDPLRRRMSSPGLARRVAGWSEPDGGTGVGAGRD